ncbi:hypothetical protein LCGC14_2793030, partial [marine sediment metagenome]
IATERGLKGAFRKRKVDLIKLLEDNDGTSI